MIICKPTLIREILIFDLLYRSDMAQEQLVTFGDGGGGGGGYGWGSVSVAVHQHVPRTLPGEVCILGVLVFSVLSSFLYHLLSFNTKISHFNMHIHIHAHDIYI